MSRRVFLNPPRVALVDPKTGRITPEWYRWFEAALERMGGTDSFSNAEIFGDYTAQQAYDELLERIGAIEALLQGMQELQHQIQELVMDFATQQLRDLANNVFESILVYGTAELAKKSGRVLIGNPTDDGTTLLQVAGDGKFDGVAANDAEFGALKVTGTTETKTLDVTEDAAVGGDLDVTGDVSAASLQVGGDQVVGARVTGWGAPSGTQDRSAYTAYAGQTVSGTYDPLEAQATDDAVKVLSEHMTALIADLRAHGLIGD